MNSLCQTCRKMLYRTDPCRGVGVACGRTDGGSKQMGNGGAHATNIPRTALPEGGAKSTAARKDVQATTLKEDRSRSAILGIADKARHRSDSGNIQETGTAKTVATTGAAATASSRLASSPQIAGTQAPPVDIPKPKHKDRHKPGYQAEKQRQYRANKKAKATQVTEYEKAMAKAKHDGTEAEFRAANMAAYDSIKAKEAAK